MVVDQLVVVVCRRMMIHALGCCAVPGGDVRAPNVRIFMTYPSRRQAPDQSGPDHLPSGDPVAGTARRRKRVLVGVVVAVLAVIAATIGAYLKLSGGGDELEAAKQRCAPVSSAALTLADGGKTLTLSLPATGANGRLLECVLEALQAPVAVRERILSAEDVRGRQADEWDRYKATWSVSGPTLSVTIEFA
jgi:hypothetical protein